MADPRRHTPYYQEFTELGAEFGDRIGFDAAVVFTSTKQEHLATRETAGLYDVYYQGPIDIKGPDAEALLQLVLARDVERRLSDGGVLYSSVCNPSGGMLDDLTVYRLSSEHFWVVATPARVGVIESWLRDHAADLRAYITNCISGTSYLSVQGPSSRDLLTPLTDADLSTESLPYYRFVQTVVGGVPTLLSRTGYSGELGYELYYPRDYASHIWNVVHNAGKELGAQPAGLGALRSVRMEKKYPLYGLDVSETTTPLEASLAWAVDLASGPFVGSEALTKQKEEGVQRLLTGIRFTDTSFMPAAGDEVMLEDRAVGSVTSADTGWTLGVNLAMAYVEPSAASDARVTVTSSESGTSGEGITTDRAFYDPERERVRA